MIHLLKMPTTAKQTGNVFRFYITLISFATLCIMSLASCRHKPSATERIILRAETLMEDSLDIDSASALIASLDRESLDNDDRPLFDLISAELRYKSFIDDTDDSLMTVASLFFEDKGDRQRQMRSKLMVGRIQYHANDLQKSIVSALEGLDIAESLRDTLYMARLNDLIADIYDASCNNQAAINWKQKAAALYKTTDRTDTYLYTLIELSNQYYNDRQHQRSIELIDSVLQIIEPYDSSIFISLKRSSLFPMVMLQRYDEAKEIIDTLMSFKSIFKLNSYDYSFLVLLNVHDGDFVSASRNLELAKRTVTSDGEKFGFYDAQKVYYEATENKDSLLAIYKRLCKDHNITIQKIMNQNTFRTERDFYSAKAREESENVKRYRTRLIYLSVIAIIIISFLLILHRLKINRKNRKLIQSMSDFINFSDNARKNNLVVSEIRNELGSSKEEIKELTDLTDGLFHDSFNLINKLSNEYFFIKTDAKSRENILKEVSETIKKMSSPEQLVKIEAGLNKISDNIISKLRTQVPTLTETDISFLTYFYAGFDYRSICLFMNITAGNFYNRRTRTKAKIENSDATDKETFLTPFNRH